MEQKGQHESWQINQHIMIKTVGFGVVTKTVRLLHSSEINYQGSEADKEDLKHRVVKRDSI